MIWIIATAIALNVCIIDVSPSEDRISTDDRILFEQIVEAECYPTWDIDGYFLIAQTVMNQLDTGKYGDTLREVLTRKGNYSVYANGRYKTVELTAKARMAVRYALDGLVPISLNTMDITEHTLFCTERNLRRYPNGTHAKAIPIMTYENVVFFKERKR